MRSMSKANEPMTNGSMHAFPHMVIDGGIIKLEGGLSKREYMAVAILQGLINSNKLPQLEPGVAAVRAAIKGADRLLAELGKGEG